MDSLLTENLVIIGSGPAGYTAAIYAARANLKPLLITGFQSGGIPGGQLMTTTFVENFPGFPDGILGPELMDLVKTQALRWGTQLIEADAESIDLRKFPFEVIADQKKILTNSLIIASGAKANRLGLKKEKLFWSKGISACAICDGATPQFRNENLAVVGGGDSACEEAVYLTKFGSHVHLIVRSNTLRASPAMADRVIANNQITVHWDSEVVEVLGKDWLEAIEIKKRTDKSIYKIPIKGLFYAIGHTPNTDFLNNQLAIDSKGYLLTEPGRPETSLDGVFAAGDVADNEWKQGVTAAGSGCKAAIAAERWLSNKKLIVHIKRKQLEPPPSKQNVEKITTEKDYDSSAIWQHGSFALRKIYHESLKPLIVIYTSPSCGPCHVLKPQLKRVLEELKGEAQAIEINIEIDTEIAEQAEISGTPTVQVFQEKMLKKQWKGVFQRSEYKEFITSLL